MNATVADKPTAYKPPQASRRPPASKARGDGNGDDPSSQIARIAASDRTAFEKRVWTSLCAIPRGRFTTYALLSRHLGSSPRAVGNALRRNPFAPQVPCHRVVATGGNLGGFKGAWPRSGEGITLDEKRGLLKGEGVRFDASGRVIGTPWGFK
ncbi:methylated-DNA-[protein]-cysteine S-methyltransferase [Geosmithia morbida]|uniref:Methylated-DNA--protein-cysteine methyltransferase n=1 Tax=Geosmithia morbida TaxID=1094350 RepID=A0A9P5D6T2_9HYPO|nr:methylated-DNA-[protein]-cysteine S-methyltransferase [Geosmithia morbida]KAF4125911.1 methylated-DNA-[protein]-cysteine S-methyltransferase [Geosmithia morbida]